MYIYIYTHTYFLGGVILGILVIIEIVLGINAYTVLTSGPQPWKGLGRVGAPE